MFHAKQQARPPCQSTSTGGRTRRPAKPLASDRLWLGRRGRVDASPLRSGPEPTPARGQPGQRFVPRWRTEAPSCTPWRPSPAEPLPSLPRAAPAHAGGSPRATPDRGDRRRKAPSRAGTRIHTATSPTRSLEPTLCSLETPWSSLLAALWERRGAGVPGAPARRVLRDPSQRPPPTSARASIRLFVFFRAPVSRGTTRLASAKSRNSGGPPLDDGLRRPAVDLELPWTEVRDHHSTLHHQVVPNPEPSIRGENCPRRRDRERPPSRPYLLFGAVSTPRVIVESSPDHPGLVPNRGKGKLQKSGPTLPRLDQHERCRRDRRDD